MFGGYRQIRADRPPVCINASLSLVSVHLRMTFGILSVMVPSKLNVYVSCGIEDTHSFHKPFSNLTNYGS